MASSAPTPAERAIAAAFYAPIGLGAQLVDNFPETVNKARQQIVLARFIGKMAVDQGASELRRRLAPPAAGPASERQHVPEPDDGPGDAYDEAAEEHTPEPVPGPAELALPDYDQLPASHIVSKLSGLTPNELDAVEAYEMAHRHRRTVLSKILQLKAT